MKPHPPTDQSNTDCNGMIQPQLIRQGLPHTILGGINAVLGALLFILEVVGLSLLLTTGYNMIMGFSGIYIGCGLFATGLAQVLVGRLRSKRCLVIALCLEGVTIFFLFVGIALSGVELGIALSRGYSFVSVHDQPDPGDLVRFKHAFKFNNSKCAVILALASLCLIANIVYAVFFCYKLCIFTLKGHRSETGEGLVDSRGPPYYQAGSLQGSTALNPPPPSAPYPVDKAIYVTEGIDRPPPSYEEAIIVTS